MLVRSFCAVAALFFAGPSFGAIVTKTPTSSGGIHTGGDNGTGQFTEFYASGNDDGFAEYPIAGFTYTAGDFGVGSLGIADINSVELSLTVNDRGFSDGNQIEFFFTPDTFASLGDGTNYTNLTYNAALTNGINAGQFGTAPISLGVYNLTEMAGRAGGEVDTFTLAFSGAALTGLVNSINAGTDFQILAGAVDASHDLTYSGVGNTFDAGDPSLAINAVPEPSSLAFLGLAVSGLALRRRRS